jgi:hypothetical protein
MGVTGTDAIIKIADHWTVRDGKVTSIWVAYFEPQALLDKLGVARKVATDGHTDRSKQRQRKRPN